MIPGVEYFLFKIIKNLNGEFIMIIILMYNLSKMNNFTKDLMAIELKKLFNNIELK